MQASLIWRATDCRASREEEKEGERSMMGMEEKALVSEGFVRRARRYSWTSRAAESELPSLFFSITPAMLISVYCFGPLGWMIEYLIDLGYQASRCSHLER